MCNVPVDEICITLSVVAMSNLGGALQLHWLQKHSFETALDIWWSLQAIVETSYWFNVQATIVPSQ